VELDRVILISGRTVWLGSSIFVRVILSVGT